METFAKGRNRQTMFKITPVKPEDVSKLIEYLKPTKNGIMLACYEQEGITGGVCFDIDGQCAYLDVLKTDKSEMEEVILKAAMNFLDLHKIYNFYVKEEKELYKRLDFKLSEKRDYKMYVNIDGYFDTHKCHH